jgi:hypothetical protein
MSVVLPFSPPGRVAVVVEGVDEPNLLTTLAREVRRMFRQFVGRWRVSVRPVDRGRWRLELSGASGRHLWVFAAPVSRLSEVVVEKLDDFLRCSPVALRPTTH